MKTYQNNFYKAIHDPYGGEMGERCETLEEMKRAIDRSNEHNKTFGYPQYRYIIAYVQWGRVFDDEGAFYSEHEVVSRIEIYPETLPKE